jgi:hypothetical protein
MNSWFARVVKGGDLRSSALKVRVGSNPTASTARIFFHSYSFWDHYSWLSEAR